MNMPCVIHIANPLFTEHASNPYVTTFVARLWVAIGGQNAPTNWRHLTIRFSAAHHRFFTHFGEDRCRMSFIHSVIEAPAGKQGFILMAISKVIFDLPTECRARLRRFGWVILLIALLVSMYPREPKTCHCIANDMGKQTLR